MLNPHFLTVEVGAEVPKWMCVEPPYTPVAAKDARQARWGALPASLGPRATLPDQ
jgi:hypothetical protein